MSKRYTYSRTLESHEGVETFTAQEFDSFDEAKSAVDKGIRDRKIQLEASKYPINSRPPLSAEEVAKEVAGQADQPLIAKSYPAGQETESNDGPKVQESGMSTPKVW